MRKVHVSEGLEKGAQSTTGNGKAPQRLARISTKHFLHLPCEGEDRETGLGIEN